MKNDKSFVIIGFKSSGKTSTGKELAQLLNLDFIDLDLIIEELYAKKEMEQVSFRDIYKKRGGEYFRDLETQALKEVMGKKNMVLATGGGAPLFDKNADILKKIGRIIYLKVDIEILYERIMNGGMPAFFNEKNPRESFLLFQAERNPVYEKNADLIIKTMRLSPGEIAEKIVTMLADCKSLLTETKS